MVVLSGENAARTRYSKYKFGSSQNATLIFSDVKHGKCTVDSGM
jgi:hypothetical protein